MSSESGSRARWYLGRTIDALDLARRGPQRPVQHLALLRNARDTLDQATIFMVDAARSEGASWAEVGRALGVSRQAARQADQRRQALDAQRADAKQWHLPLPTRRRRFRWLPRRAA